MKVTRATEYWSVPEDGNSYRTATPLSAAEIANLVKGPRIPIGSLHWAAAPGKIKTPGEVDDPSIVPGAGDIRSALPSMGELQNTLYQGGPSYTDGTPERWPGQLPGDKVLNAVDEIGDGFAKKVDKKIDDLKPEKKKEARRRHAGPTDWSEHGFSSHPNPGYNDPEFHQNVKALLGLSPELRKQYLRENTPSLQKAPRPAPPQASDAPPLEWMQNRFKNTSTGYRPPGMVTGDSPAPVPWDEDNVKKWWTEGGHNSPIGQGWTNDVWGDRAKFEKFRKDARRRYAEVPPSPDDLFPTGEQTDSTHDAVVHADKSNRQQWLVKHPRFQEHWPAALDVGTAAIQQRSGLVTPEIHSIEMRGIPTPVHKMIPGATKAFPGKYFNHSQLSSQDIMTLQKHNVLDWMLSNHDAHPGQFIRDPQSGELVGIDKGQAFRYFGKDKLSPNFHPNKSYGETEPIYNTMWRNFGNGQGHMHDPRSGELGLYINNLQSMPDEEFQSHLRPYAELAAGYGKLATGTATPNDPDAFLAAATARKNNLGNDFANYYTQALAKRQGAGSKVGRVYR